MKPLLIGLIVFFAIHTVPALPRLRAKLAGAMGEDKYKRLFSLTSLAGLILVGMGFSRAEFIELWQPLDIAWPLAIALMPVALTLIIAANFPCRLRQKLRHPMMIGILMWALLHLMANGDLASAVLFGSFALYSVSSVVSAQARGKVPGTKPVAAKYDLIAIALGAGGYAAVLWGHEMLFGVSALV